MSYRIQIDVYGDNNHNKEADEKSEKRNDRWIKLIAITLLMIIFVFYVREMFSKELIDSDQVINIKNRDNSILYTLKYDDLTKDTLLVDGRKNVDGEALLTYKYFNGGSSAYTVKFSNNKDWLHSLATIYNSNGEEVYSKQLNGHLDSRQGVDPTISMGTTSELSNNYDKMLYLTLRQGFRLRGNMLLFSLVILLVIVEFTSFKYWDLIFKKFRIKWAIGYGDIPSQLYKQSLMIGRFIVFIGITVLMVKSYYN